MAKYYFYTDPSQIGAGQVFGPDGPDDYNFTHTHSAATKTAAIAVCSGAICFQEISNGVGTLILRPSYQPHFDFPYIQYFIYKNIDLTDYIHASNGLQGDSHFPFISDLRARWEENTADKVKSAREVLGLAYKANPTDPNLPNIFLDTDPVDNLFHIPNKDRQLPHVNAGDKIGNFLIGGGGFEIRLERLGHTLKLAEVREAASSLTVAALGGGETDAQIFDHWHKKDACLNYIDPCAFFGSFAGSRLFYEGGGPAGHRDDIVTDVLATCANKNKVYLDIRNDYGFALNYFEDRGQRIFVKHRQNSDSHELDQNVLKWPIFSFTLAELNSSGAMPGEMKSGFLKTSLQFPQGNASVPLVYLSKAHVRRFRNLKRKERIQFPKDITGPFSLGVNISFPTVSNDAELCPGYFKINFYDMDRDQSAASQTPTLAPSKEHYLNGLFRPLDMEQTISKREGSLYYTLWHEEVLVNLTDVGGPCYVASLGVAVDEDHTTMFAFPEYFVHGTLDGNIPKAFTTWATSSQTSDKMFIQKVFDVFKHKSLSKQELDIAGVVDNLDVIVVENTPFNLASEEFRQTENPEDYVMVSFENPEIQSQKSILTTHVPSLLPKSAFLIHAGELETEDLNGVSYLSYEIDCVGLNLSGALLQKLRVNLDKKVYQYGDY